MKHSSKLSVALHALAHLAARPHVAMTSHDLSTCLLTNPVVVRRVMGDLRRAGLVVSSKGHNGGWSLTLPAEDISLRDVYIALGERLLIRTDMANGSPSCGIVRTVSAVMSSVLDNAEVLLSDRLAAISIAGLGQQIPNKDHSHV